MLTKRNRLCTITFNKQSLALSLFSFKDSNVFLHAHETFPLHKREIVGARIFNPTTIIAVLKKFAYNHNLKNTPVSSAIRGDYISEKQVATHNASPEKKELIAAAKHTLSEACYLHPTQDGTFSFYTCSIEQPLLLQYKLLALQSNLNLVSLTTHTIALLHAYKQMHKDTFRHSQLGLHLAQKNNNFENIINAEMVWRLLQSAPRATLPEHIDPPILLTHCGLAFMHASL